MPTNKAWRIPSTAFVAAPSFASGPRGGLSLRSRIDFFGRVNGAHALHGSASGRSRRRRDRPDREIRTQAHDEALHLKEVAAMLRSVRNRALYRDVAREIEKSITEARVRLKATPESEAVEPR